MQPISLRDLALSRSTHGFHILVSLCRHLKQLQADDPAWGPTMDFYTGEFEAAMSGKL